MKIRVIETKEDKEEALHIRTTVFVDEQNVSIEEEIDAFENDAVHFIGHEDNIAIAASRLRLIEDFGKLERICILKEYRGKSHGTEIIQAMEKVVIDNGYSKTKLNAQTRAIKFYEKLGYKVISDEFLDAGIPHVTMSKQLNNAI